jgi:hypothetical protein
MITFKIQANTGINFDNLPGDMFAMINRLDDEDGILSINCEDVVENDIISCLRNFYTNTFRERLIFGREPDGNISVQKYAPIPQQPLNIPQQTPYNPAPMDMTRIVGTPVQGPCRLEPVDETDNHENNENLDDDNENEFSSHMEKSMQIPVSKADNDKEKALLARSMRNNLSSSSSVTYEKITELNKLMARSIILRNEIDLLMKPINENPKISMIIDQIKSIKDGINDISLIKDIYVNTNGDISVLTKKLTTETLGDDSVRDVGEMEIIISSGIVLSENLSTTAITNPIKIKNLTHILNSNDSLYVCGHALIEQICFGSVYEQIHKALLDKNIAMIIELIIRFIKNPNINDTWGKYILGFPKVERANL